MPDDIDLERRLRHLAGESLARRAASVDADAELAALQARIAGLPSVAKHRIRRDRTRWLTVAAAAALVLVAVAAIVWPRGGDPSIVNPPVDSSLTTPLPTTAPPSPPTTTATPTTPPTRTSPPSTPATPAGPATASPATVAAGKAVTVTPSGTIQRMCNDRVTLVRIDGDAAGTGGRIDNGGWLPALDSEATSTTLVPCAGERSASAVSLVIPVDVPPGEYQTCLGERADPAGCATVVVTAAAEIVPPGPLEIGLGYFGRRDVGTPPTSYAIDQIDPDGSVVGTLSDPDVTALFPRHILNDGPELTLEGPDLAGRCTSQLVTLTTDGSRTQIHPDLPAARSIGVTATGIVLATRDVCPAGTRWGDPGTRWELVAVDPGVADPQVRVLQTRLPDPSQILFQDGGYVVAVGEPTIQSVSPDGRYVALRESYNSEDARWMVLDLEAPEAMLPIDSTCELPGAIVGPPSFVGDGIVVVARLCSPLYVADAPTLLQTIGDGDVQVEAIDLGAAPSERIIWHGSVPGIGAHGYSRTVGLSARLDDDGSVWALLSAGGATEVPNRNFVLHGDGATEITDPAYNAFAFAPGELISPSDQPPT